MNKQKTKSIQRLIVVTAILSLFACNNNLGTKPNNPNKYASLKQQNFSIENATIATIHSALQNHQATCEQIVIAYLERIRKYDLSISTGNPPLNAISEINPSVIDEAKHLDQLYAQTGKITGNMFCIPVVIKDSIDVMGLNSTAGSYALLGAMPKQDAPLVKALRNQNAIILGKSTMNEFGFFPSSSRNGMAGNAYDTTKPSGGSSSGSAVAVASNLAVTSIGVDSGGSIRIPSALNGVYGLRPTQELIDGSGSFNMQPLTTVSGPIARNVTDLAIELGTIASTTTGKYIDYKNSLDINGLKNKRLGVINYLGNINMLESLSTEEANAFNQVRKNLAHSGATLVDVDFPYFNTNNELYVIGGGFEAVANYLNTLTNTNLHTFEDICNTGKFVDFGHIESCIATKKQLDFAPGSPEYLQATALLESNSAYVNKIMEEQHLDGLIVFSTSMSGGYQGPRSDYETSLSSFTGIPSMVLPIGFDKQHIPMAIELYGRKYTEAKILSIAYAYEQTYGGYVAPNLVADSKLQNLSIDKLNLIFTTIGINDYNQIMLHNKPISGITTPKQMQQLTKQSIQTIIGKN